MTSTSNLLIANIFKINEIVKKINESVSNNPVTNTLKHQREQ